MANRPSACIERLWDRATAHISRHPRKYTAAGFVFIFLPQWLPSFVAMIEKTFSMIPAVGLSTWFRTLQSTMPSLSGSWVTAPLGLLFMFLIWRETRSRRPSIDIDSNKLPPSSARQRLADAISRQHLEQASELPEGIVSLAWKPGPKSLDLEVTDISTEVIESFNIQVLDVHRWTEIYQHFVEVPDVHEKGRFRVLDLHVQPVTINASGYVGSSSSYRLFHGTPLTYLFLNLEGDHLQFGGQEGSALGIYTIRTPGTWRVGLRLRVRGASYGRPAGIAWELDRTAFMFFRWDGQTVPEPCNEPSTS